MLIYNFTSIGLFLTSLSNIEYIVHNIMTWFIQIQTDFYLYSKWRVSIRRSRSVSLKAILITQSRHLLKTLLTKCASMLNHFGGTPSQWRCFTHQSSSHKSEFKSTDWMLSVLNKIVIMFTRKILTQKLE